MSADWIYDIGHGYSNGPALWGNGEVEYASDSTANVRHDGQGHLLITPVRDSSGEWTSGRIETARTDLSAPAGGELYLSASIMLPDPADASGYWPAFWALGADSRPIGGTNWPAGGELDMMESVNGRDATAATLHCGAWQRPPCNEPTGLGSGLIPCSGCRTGFHSYGVVIDRRDTSAEQLRFLRDGVVVKTINESQVGTAVWSAAVDHGWFIILDVAIGGAFPDGECGCNSLANPTTSGSPMVVDSVSAMRLSAAVAPTIRRGGSAVAPAALPRSAVFGVKRRRVARD
nr:family 16 glycosylhydrolase [Galbitalea soli]